MKVKPDVPPKAPMTVFQYSKGSTEKPKTSGIKIRGTGAATKGVIARGPMA
jgi:hypothetical protein